MSSRGKQKQALRPKGGGMSLETKGTAPDREALNRMISMPDSSFSAVRERKDEAFRAGVDARKDVLRLIETNNALHERVQEVFEEGRQVGCKQAAWPVIKCCMAGACLMLKEAFRMDDDEDIVRGLKVLHNKITWALNYSELCDDVLAKTGIELHLDDPFEPIQRI